MKKLIMTFLVFIPACSMHTGVEMGDETIFKQESIVYSKVINYWVDGKYVGVGKNKRWIPGYWDKKLANPNNDPEFMWVSGQWKEIKNEK